MSEKVNVTLRMDKELKAEADELFKDLGLNLSTAITMFMKQSIREQKLPFTAKRNQLNKETIKAIKEAEDENKLNGPFYDMKSLMESLNA